MITIKELDELTSLSNDALLVADNSDNTLTNSISFANIKSQIIDGLVENVEVLNGQLVITYKNNNTPTTYNIYTNTYLTSDNSSSTINDTDYVPMSNGDGSKKKTLWSTIINKIKSALGTAAVKNVPVSGNASTTEVVMGNDSRLSDSRNANDVYDWAKASTKPTYTASEVGAIASTLKGANNGVAELDSSGKVPSSQLPSFVDDVLEYSAKASFPATGETGKIYVDTTTNKTYRWSGSAYVEISESIALGETSSTAYRGDRGKTAYDHSQSTHARTDATKVEASSTNGNIKINGTETTVYTHPGSGTNPHGTTKSDVGLGNVGNFKAVSTVASQGLTDTEKSNARANIGAGTSSLAIGTTSSTAAAGNHTHTSINTQTLSAVKDANTSGENGKFTIDQFIAGSSQNLPDSTNTFTVMTSKNSDGTKAFQIAGSSTSHYAYFRNYANGTGWSSWYSMRDTNTTTGTTYTAGNVPANTTFGTNGSIKNSYDSLNSNKAPKSEAIKNITRSGTTFTATRCDDTTFTFTQQDNNTTYSVTQYTDTPTNLSAFVQATAKGTLFSYFRFKDTNNVLTLGAQWLRGYLQYQNGYGTPYTVDGQGLVTTQDNNTYLVTITGTTSFTVTKKLFRSPTGNATAAQVLSGYTFANVSSDSVTGTMANQGTKTYTINPGGQQTIPAGYHSGSGYVKANPNQNSGTYTPTTRAASIDMGANNTYRYVTTTSVPNTNSAEYTFPANDTGGKKDLGANNTYRYVTATNVYNKGKADGATVHSTTYTFPSGDTGGTKDLGTSHAYRYVNASNVYYAGRTRTICFVVAGKGYQGNNIVNTFRYYNSEIISKVTTQLKTASSGVKYSIYNSSGSTSSSDITSTSLFTFSQWNGDIIIELRSAKVSTPCEVVVTIYYTG